MDSIKIEKDSDRARAAERQLQFDLKYSKGKCSEEELLRKPFLTLKTPHAKNWLSVKSMDGNFVMDELAGLMFTAKINSSAKANLPCVDDYSDSLAPLLQMLCKTECQIRIVGRSFPGCFYIKGLHVINQEAKAQSSQVPDFVMSTSERLSETILQMNETTLQLTIEKLLDFEQSNTGRAARHLSQPCTTRQELTLLFEVCKHTYPQTIQEWAENNFQMLKSHQLGQDDRRHILKALSYVLNIDWNVRPPSVPDLNTIKRELDKRFFGLESVKQQILEVSSQIRQSNTLPKWGILLHGPAGVGKTSIANAICEILGMPKAHIEFSIIQDSEGLTGSSRIYSNAKPGLIIEQLYAHRTANLAMTLNEVDKAAAAKDRTNPLNMLLPLLDGLGFTDTYLEVTIPTQGLFFIATCNDLSALSRPILDRFFKICIPAYSKSEKRMILDQYIIPRVLEDVKINPQEFSVTEEAKALLLQDYAVEPGVRDLEQYVEKMATHFLMRKELENTSCIKFAADDLRRLFGPAKVVQRNYSLLPGMVFSAFIHDGAPYIFTVQTLLRRGTGELRMININSISQREYCRIAYEHLKSCISKLDCYDVILTINQPIPESAHNFIGLSVCASILSAITGVTFSPTAICFGGADLHGSFYADANLAQFLQQVEGFDTVYTAFGSIDYIHAWDTSSKIEIIQLPNTRILFEMIIGSKNSNRN